MTITIDISLADHFIDFLVCELLTKVGHDVAQFRGRDVAIAILVEHAESFLDFLLRIRILYSLQEKLLVFCFFVAENKTDMPQEPQNVGMGTENEGEGMGWRKSSRDENVRRQKSS